MTKSHRTKLQDKKRSAAAATKSRVGQPRVRRRDAEQIRNPEVQRIFRRDSEIDRVDSVVVVVRPEVLRPRLQPRKLHRWSRREWRDFSVLRRRLGFEVWPVQPAPNVGPPATARDATFPSPGAFPVAPGHQRVPDEARRRLSQQVVSSTQDPRSPAKDDGSKSF